MVIIPPLNHQSIDDQLSLMAGMRVKLTELVNSISSRVREVTNFIRYPFQSISYIARRRFQEEYERIEIPVNRGTSTKEKAEQEVNSKRLDVSTVRTGIIEKNSGVSADVTERLAKRKYRGAEAIPILEKEQEIRGGRRGRYRVEALLEDTERMRLYQGIQVLNSKPVLIKEYLLFDQDFNQKEAKECKEKFERIATLNLKNGGGQDFRLISPWDAIAPPSEKRCYLIFEPTPNNSLTLREYLAGNGPMTTQQVRQVLYQVLQTLWFLHTQRLPISNDEVLQGVAHGNLNLDSILIATNTQVTALNEPQFFIYLTDLLVWEDLFKPPNSKAVKSSETKDLKDLGYVSFYLLSGTVVNPIFEQPLAPNIELHWPDMNDVALKKFIYRLLGISQPFQTAFEARQALLASQVIEREVLPDNTEQPAEKVKKYSLLQILLFLAITVIFLACLWQLISFGLQLIRGKNEFSIVQSSSEVCCLAEVSDVPNRQVKYITESDGIWSYIMVNNSLVNYGRSLEQELKNRDPRLANYTLNNNSSNVIEDIRNGADFALTSFVENLPDNLQQEEVAYDGLVVFVAFSDNQRQLSIPNALNGKITLQQLRELYTTQSIENWSLPSKLKKEIKIYMPTDSPKTIQLFEQLVFKGEPPEQLEKFRELMNTRLISSNGKNNEAYILGEILKDFEDRQTVGIGFGLLSRVFNQCAVYPLAVGEKDREIQPLVQRVKNQVKPIDPTTDLCDDKGSYWPDVEAFKSGKYPLMYRLVVVYPKDEKRGQPGKKFAELLKTDEGQRLLRESGLVPLRTLPNNN
ncbi:MAG TPA: phosphate ABC transporter substrate-binding protein [Cyanobacteria bacterium UBA11369]|nr:phosphate ABC transporter substrate-binding protein [Cyanobacteria bacterium UBA11371]HBE18364.1 phosphate ABC transporter substrate-binding protein [Cyanobacteria bacterium UBA11367]HBE29798.1 phosphate ABC transporter substrate-binding protein [Cyanobacteria bacterium UBA11368]HBE48412.1 phosphate ABC transporter substrate-binding protein [Cyanobacteria bacterium UBA11369]